MLPGLEVAGRVVIGHGDDHRHAPVARPQRAVVVGVEDGGEIVALGGPLAGRRADHEAGNPAQVLPPGPPGGLQGDDGGELEAAPGTRRGPWRERRYLRLAALCGHRRQVTSLRQVNVRDHAVERVPACLCGMTVRALHVAADRGLARDAAVPVEGPDVTSVVDLLADLVTLGPAGNASRAREQVSFD